MAVKDAKRGAVKTQMLRISTGMANFCRVMYMKPLVD